MIDCFGEGDFDVIDGEELRNRIAPSLALPRRDSFQLIKPWLFDNSPRIMFLTGLRRTGKTTMMEQTIGEMPESIFDKTAFIQAYDDRSYEMLDIIGAMRELQEKGKRYFFLDEATFAENFPAGCMRLPDGFAKNGCRVCVTGTHSLAIWLAKTNYLQGRYEEIKTTSIPFAEWSRLLFDGDLPDTVLSRERTSQLRGDVHWTNLGEFLADREGMAERFGIRASADDADEDSDCNTPSQSLMT